MAPDDNADDDPKVKELLNPATEADLARWFSLPSFQQFAEQPPPPEPSYAAKEMQARVAQRDKALANVDPAFLAAVDVRNEQRGALATFTATIDVRIVEDIGLFDRGMVDRVGVAADPREVEVPQGLDDALKECTPQALLRDLHRAELYFDKVFEVVDMAAEQRFDIVAAVKTAMTTNWKLPRLDVNPVAETRAILGGLRAERRRSWLELLPALPRRRVKE